MSLNYSSVSFRNQPVKTNSSAFKGLIGTLVAVGFASPVFGATTIWFGGAGDWGVGANWSAGQPGTGDVAIINAGNATLNFNTTILGLTQSSGTIAGLGNPTFTGASTWTGGSHTGAATSTFNNALAISGNVAKGISTGRTISAGDTTWTGNTSANGNQLLFSTGTFNNTGSFTDSNAFDTSMSGSGTFNNSGIYNKQRNTFTDIVLGFNNTGTVNVNAGTMRLQGTGTHTGAFVLAPGGVLNFIGGSNNTFNSGSSITGAGTFRLDSGTVNLNAGASLGASVPLIITNGSLNFNSPQSVSSLTQSSGTIAGLGNLTFTGASTWTGGSHTGLATTTFSNSLNILGNNAKGISAGRTITAGNTAWALNTSAGGNQLSFSAGAFNNTGTFTDTNAFDSGMSGGGVFINGGTYNKQTNTLSDIAVSFSNTGTVNVNAGTMRVSSALTNNGVINVSAGATFNGSNTTFVNAGTLTGVGTVATHLNGDIVNQAAVNPGNTIGKLTVDATLALTNTSALTFELASASNFDVLAVTRNVTLGGAIIVQNAGYVPVLGENFKVLTFDQRLAGSTFSGISTVGFGSGVTFDAIYNLHDVTLVVAAVPEPEHWVMLLVGLGALGIATRGQKRAKCIT